MSGLFHKSYLEFNKGEDRFACDGVEIAFKDVEAIYSRGTEYITNSVYEKRERTVTLVLQDAKEVVCTADTNTLEKYKSLSELYEAVTAYRYKRLHLTYLQEDTLSFHTKQEEYSLLFKGKKLFVKYDRARRVNSTDFEVEMIRQDGLTLELEGEGEKEVTNVWFISDIELFTQLASEQVEFTTRYEMLQKKMLFEARLYRYFMIFFIPFGINGIGEIFFKSSLFRHTEPIATLSLIAGMLLAIVIVTMPMYMLVDKYNARKRTMQRDILAGKRSTLKKLDFSDALFALLFMMFVWYVLKIQ